MRAYSIVAAALLLLLQLCAATAPAAAAGGGRRLQGAALDCKKAHPSCSKCRQQAISKGSSAKETVCTACKAGWALRAGSNKICDCAAGSFLSAKGTCTVCPARKWCPGGSKANPKSLASDCPVGTASTARGAKAITSCLTLRGYALVTTGDDGKPTYYGKPCPAGTYNPGGNDALWPSCFRCMMGMTTNSTGATSWGDCVAPAGWYYDADANAARMCPKGTFTAAPSRVGACTPCNEGVTTLGFGSDSPLACDRAQPGWSYQGGGASAPCPDDTYNDADNEAATCTPCPNGKRTQFDPRFVKPVSVDACDVPPGNELTDGVVTPCAVNSSKADWGDRACEPCGAGLFTASAGAEYCLVPAGSGLVSFRPPLAAEPCPRDTYGSNEARPVGGMYGLNARCSMCPPHLFTDESPPDGSGYMSVTACKVMPGWGMSGSLGAQWPALCAQGTYNEGRNREPCKPCPDGNTTEDVGATSAADCVAATAP